MNTLFDAAQVRQVETFCLARVPGGSLIDRAGRALARRAEVLSLQMPAPVRMVALTGPGHNGDDARSALQHLASRGFATAGIPLASLLALGDDETGRAHFLAQLDESCLLIDGLFGIGLNRPLAPALCSLFASINQRPCRVLAVDLPSGLDASSGGTWGAALRADQTLSFLLDKTGLHTGEAAAFVGQLQIDALGCEDLIGQALAQDPALARGRAQGLDETWLARHLPSRSATAHKGTQGSVLVVGGNAGMRGAAVLAALAARAAGAGKTHVHLLGADKVQHEALTLHHPGLMTCPTWPQDPTALKPYDALLLGCGLGQDRAATHALESLLSSAARLAMPVVLDADALNLLASGQVRSPGRDQMARLPWVATPHPLEAARLLGSTVAAVQADRLAAAQALARQWGLTVVLKGPGSVIARPGPDAQATPPPPALAPVGSATLAVGGSGDILAGVILGLLGQGLEAGPAAALGTCAHALAGADALGLLGKAQGLSPEELPALVRARLNAAPGTPLAGSCVTAHQRDPA